MPSCVASGVRRGLGARTECRDRTTPSNRAAPRHMGMSLLVSGAPSSGRKDGPEFVIDV
jgi:hypothetical protein